MKLLAAQALFVLNIVALLVGVFLMIWWAEGRVFDRLGATELVLLILTPITAYLVEYAGGWE